MAGAWRSFVHRYGWRAYALPLLAVVTVAALTTTHDQPSAAQARHDARSRPAGFDAAAHTAPTPTATASSQPEVISTSSDGSACLDNTAQRLVLVSIEQQHAWMCDGHRQVYSSAVTTGATTGDRQTPKGTWYIQDRQRNRYLVGPGYRVFVHYWIPFNGDFGFHDSHWQTFPYGSPEYATGGSHGCVHMPLTTMQWFYDWAVPGMVKVNIT